MGILLKINPMAKIWKVQGPLSLYTYSPALSKPNGSIFSKVILIYMIYIEDATDGKISLPNSRSCKEQIKGKDFVALPPSWRLVIT